MARSFLHPSVGNLGEGFDPDPADTMSPRTIGMLVRSWPTTERMRAVDFDAIELFNGLLIRTVICA